MKKWCWLRRQSLFKKEDFERLFNAIEVLDGVPLGDDVCALFGLLAEFKREDPGFCFCASFDKKGVLNFLGPLWSSQKAMLGLFGDLLIVDSVHGFTSYGYHVINVTLVDNTLCSQFGAIGLIMGDNQVTYNKLFDFVKSEVCFIRPPRVLMADGAKQIHNAFDQVFPGSNHVFCSFHLKEHIRKWFAGCKERDTLVGLVKDGLFATNQSNLEITMEHIKELSGDAAGKVMGKVSAYLTLHSHPAGRTSSQHTPQQVGDVNRGMVS